MALVSGVSLFRSRDEILDDFIAGIKLRIPDAFDGEEGTLHILFEVFAGVVESVFLANDLLSDDEFVLTASEEALDRRGDEYGLARNVGLQATGSLLFSGDGGTDIDAGTEVAYDPGTGEDPFYYLTSEAATIPNPGVSSAPVAADNGAGTLAAGSYEYEVSFVTAAGETIPGPESNAVVIAINHNIHLTNIPVGGPGTIARTLYENINGVGWTKVTDPAVVAALNNNVTTDVVITAGTRGGVPLETSTAEAISIAATAEESGLDYNVPAGVITVLTNAPDGVTNVTNPAPFVNGTDSEGFEDYRIRLLQAIRNPQTGSAADLELWAEEVSGVETATAFQNDNEGVATNGHTTIRIAGPNGSVPDADVIAATQTALDAKDIANVTIHVTTFDQTPTDVDVTLTLTGGYDHTDVDPGVAAAIEDYINGLGVGETLRVAGISSAIFGLTGVADVIVNTPATNLATGATAKRTPGTITIS